MAFVSHSNTRVATALAWIQHTHMVQFPQLYCFEPLSVAGGARSLTPKESAAYDAAVELLTRTLRGELDAPTEAEIKAVDNAEQRKHEMAVERLKATIQLRKARLEARAEQKKEKKKQDAEKTEEQA